MTKKKVILISRCAWTLYNFRGGLIRALVKEGAEVIGGGAGGDGYEAKVKSLGIPFMSIPVSKHYISPLADFQLLWKLYRWYRKERPHIVHHFTIRPVIYGTLAARLAGVPRIVNTITGLGTVFGDNRLAWLRSIVERQYRLALGFAHWVFFQNDEDLRLFLSKGIVEAKKCEVVPGSGVDCEHFKPQRAPSPSPNDSVTFLMVARIILEKGVYDFAEAARRVQQVYPSAKFQLLGKRDERNPNVVPENVLERWQAEGVLTWLGEVDDVRPILERTDVVVLPSYYREGVPRSLLEAAAMARPIITTNTTGCQQVVDHEKNGILVPTNNPGALADAMIRLIEHPILRMEMGMAGREKMKQRFEERLVIERISRSYRE